MMLPSSLCLGAFAAAVAAIPTVEIKGSKFFTSDGNQWFVKGIAYQLVSDDPLVDSKQCGLDADLMKTLGTNAIRVYHVDPKANHDACMKIFADAGIYTFIDLDTFNSQIEQTAPRWNATQLSAFQAVMDTFHNYDNVAGFFVGNEVLTTGEGSKAAPYVKAAARDLKAYRDSKKYRKIPVGYSAADIATLRPMLQNFLACGTNASEAIDFYALNAYEWCGDSSYTVSGYADLTKNVTSYNIPIFFSETGCNTIHPRTFADQAAIFGPDMAPYWSGSIIYEWIEEANNYGIIQYGPKVDPASPGAPPDGFLRSGTPTPINPDFENLKNVWKTAIPSGVKASAYTPSLKAPDCPAATPGTWEVDPKVIIPAVGQQVSTASGNGSSSSGGSGNSSGGSSSSKNSASGLELNTLLSGTLLIASLATLALIV